MSSMLRIGAAGGMPLLPEAMELDRAGDRETPGISSKLRTGDRGEYGDDDRPTAMLAGRLGPCWRSSSRARTSLRSSSSMASMDMGCFDMMAGCAPGRHEVPIWVSVSCVERSDGEFEARQGRRCARVGVPRGSRRLFCR